MMNNKTSKQPVGPDPGVEQAINRIVQTQLSPLEEVIFKSWLAANEIEDADNPENPIDYRGLYKATGGKLFPPGELNRQLEQSGAIDTLMKAQEGHEQMSPMKMMMDRMGQNEDSGGPSY